MLLNLISNIFLDLVIISKCY